MTLIVLERDSGLVHRARRREKRKERRRRGMRQMKKGKALVAPSYRSLAFPHEPVESPAPRRQRSHLRPMAH